MTNMLILKYLNPSAATAKGHMKCRHHGIQSTQPKPGPHMPPTNVAGPRINLVPIIAPPVWLVPQFELVYPISANGEQRGSSVIVNNGDKSITNIFCFGAFANKNTGIVYHDLTGSFPFMSFDGMVCFFELNHYESNAILAPPLQDWTMLPFSYFKEFSAKKFKPKLNIMDSQATKHIKTILTKNNWKITGCGTS